MESTNRDLVIGKAEGITLPGSSGKRWRKQRLKTLVSVIVGNYGWRRDFLKHFPQYDTQEGTYALNRATSGRTDDPGLLNAMEEFIPYVIDSEPEWWVKRPNPIPTL